MPITFCAKRFVRNVLCETFCAKVLCETFCAKVLCESFGRNVLGETFWAVFFLELHFASGAGCWGVPLSKRSQDAPEPLSKWSGRVPRSVCGWNAWGISTLPAFALENTNGA